MKKLVCTVLAVCMICLSAGCSNPDSLRLELSRGYGQNLKLIHLNASTEEKRERIDAFAQAIVDARPLEKDFSMFAYYPDYRLKITGKALSYSLNSEGIMENVSLTEGKDCTLTAIVDINGDYVDFYLPELQPDTSPVIYRSQMTASDFNKLVNRA